MNVVVLASSYWSLRYSPVELAIDEALDDILTDHPDAHIFSLATVRGKHWVDNVVGDLCAMRLRDTPTALTMMMTEMPHTETDKSVLNVVYTAVTILNKTFDRPLSFILVPNLRRLSFWANLHTTIKDSGTSSRLISIHSFDKDATT